MQKADDRHDDPILEQRLRAYFSGRPIEPLAVETFWRRLEPTIEQHAHSAANNGAKSAVMTQRDIPDTPGVPPVPDVPQRPGARRPHTTSKRRVVGNLLAVAAVLAICLSTFALFYQRHVLMPGATKTIQRGELLWRKVALPSGVILIDGEGGQIISGNGATDETNMPAPTASLKVAPSNGNVAYICQMMPHGTAQVWRTGDAGQHWTLLPALPTPDTSDNIGCEIAIDANNPDTVIVGVGDPGLRRYTASALFAGADHWTRLTQGVGRFASWNGVYYGILQGGAFGVFTADGSPQRLYISTDNMRTWRETNDEPLLTENSASAKAQEPNSVIGVSSIWVQPKTGELLAQTFDGVLWQSSDHGQHWTRIKLPALPPAAELTPTPGEPIMQGSTTAALAFVQQPVDSKPFTLCAMILDQQQIDYNVAPLYCSNDSGQSWTRRPRTAVDWGHGKPSSFELPLLMLADGELLAWDVQNVSMYPGANASAPAARVIGTIPPPRASNLIPAGLMGATPSGVTLWQPWDPYTLYVAVYNVTTNR